MRIKRASAAFIAALAVVAFVVGCGGDGKTSDEGSSDGIVTMPVTAALLDSLPEYESATQVREWLVAHGRVHVREYAVAEAPEQAADAVTRHFRDALLVDGWQESGAHAAVSALTKAGMSVVIGRVGPQLQEPPGDATLLNSVEPPAASGFFFTLEADEAGPTASS